jgi:O-antigen biosynthesis protein
MPDARASDPRVLAFYLPQFHPIPENDAWWGSGFTEWTNTVRAQPLWPGHRQPHLPADLGFYDLRLPETREAQARLARAYGIDGFCYYHYWFHGRRLLDRPLREVRELGRPDFPFCMLWANEPWTRVWDGGYQRVLIDQAYDADDDIEHIRYLIPFFSDPRYIRVEGRPLLGIYRVQALPEPKRTFERWRAECEQAGLPAPYLVKFDTHANNDDPAQYGCDAAAEFPPHHTDVRVPLTTVEGAHPGNRLHRYSDLVELLPNPSGDWLRYPSVLTGWDNSPRRPDGTVVAVIDESPELFERWLRGALDRARREAPDHPLVFINAWNEWAEGAHLEPDRDFGRRFLHAVAAATGTSAPVIDEPAPPPIDPAVSPEAYSDLYDGYVRLQSENAMVRESVDARVSEAVAEREAALEVARAQVETLAEWASRLRTRPELAPNR